ncbi:MAG: Holliday junction branch migration protein RuvA [Micrococcus sp.]|nr:Holliday junction branch migration protein RuvA [Micrococcus sp.]
MISSLTGTVQRLALDRAVLDVQGVGMLVHATPRTIAGLREGASARVHTHLVVKEDSLTLFGFAEHEEQEVFEILLGANGVGPRLALAVLAVHTAEAVRHAVTDEDEKALTRVPGVGPKLAKKMIVELAGKLPPTTAAATPEVPPAGAAAEDARWHGAVLEAMTGLGWSLKDAEKAVTATLAARPELDERQDVAALLRATLADVGAAATVRGGRGA